MSAEVSLPEDIEEPVFSLDTEQPLTREILESSGMYREEQEDPGNDLEAWRYRGTRLIYDPELQEAIRFETYRDDSHRI